MRRLAKYLSRDRVLFLDATSKKEALNDLVDAIGASRDVEAPEELRKAVFDREKTLSTGIGLGIAVPHAKIPTVQKFVLAVGISHVGIPFDSLDGSPVKIIVMIVGPEGQQEQYLQILARTTLILKNEANREAILAAPSPDALYELFQQGGEQ